MGMTHYKSLRRWIKSKMVIDMDKIARVLYKYRTRASNYFELTRTGAVLFKASFEGRYLILVYLLAKLYQLIAGLGDREDASIKEILELPFPVELDIDSELNRLLKDDLVRRSNRGYCLNYRRLAEIFDLLDDYLAAQA
ncbi:MAG: hypothetical protein DRN64_04510 [Thaumarchaeota archaeon]|nr:MAG: hypothetical protein DRN64_04510 [Nitrososphaerota archaeon]